MNIIMSQVGHRSTVFTSIHTFNALPLIWYDHKSYNNGTYDARTETQDKRPPQWDTVKM
jgi:hypothetical protein